MERTMDAKREDAAARKAVTTLLRRYFEDLKTRVAAGTTEFWSRIEQRLMRTKAEPDSTTSASEPTRQPTQQQQARIEPDEKKKT